MASTGIELATAYISILPSTRGMAPALSKALGGANGVAAKAGEKTGGFFSNALNKSISRLGKTVKWGALGLGALVVGTAVKGGIARALNIEDAQAKLKGLGHDTKAVDGIMKNALASVKGTAFGLGDAAKVAAGAVAAGVKPGKELERTLKLTGDAATIAGMGMGEMGAIFNKVASSNKIQGDVIAQLQDAGIPVVQLMAKELGVTAEETVKMASAGKINFATFQAAMEKGLGGAALESGKTFRGALANVKAALGRLGETALKPFLDMLRVGFNKAIPIIDTVAGAFGGVLDVLIGGQFTERMREAFNVEEDSNLVNFLFNVRDGVKGISALLFQGKFTESFRMAFNVEEDAPIVDKLFNIRESILGTKDEVKGGLTAMVLAFQDGGRDITSSGFAGILETIGLVARNLWDAIGPAAKVIGPAVWEIISAFSPLGLILKALLPVLPELSIAAGNLAGALAGVLAQALQALAPLIAGILTGLAGVIGWMTQNETRMQVFAGIIMTLLVPALLTWGTQAAIAGAKNVMAWAASAKGAVTTALTYSTQGVKIIASWVAMGLAAVKSGAETVAVWLMYQWESVKAVAAMVAAKVKIAAQWALMSAAAVASGIKTAAVWTAQIIASAASGAVSFALSAGKVIAQWVLMGTQSLLQAARMAAAWVVAMGPVAWVTAAVIAVAAVIWANWDKIRRWTVDLWGKSMDKLAQFRDFLVGKFAQAITWIYTHTIKPVWDKVTAVFDGAWRYSIKPMFDVFIKLLRGDFPGAFKYATELAEKYWNGLKKIASKPVDFVVNTVINKGLIGTFNKIAKKIPGVGELPEVHWKGFASGGWTGHGSKNQPAGIVHADEFVVRKESQQDLRRKAPGFLDAVNRFGAKALGFAKGGLVHPMPAGYRRVSAGWHGYPGHLGTDYPAPVGTAVNSPGPGYVARTGWNLPGGTGKQVWVQHDNGLLTRVHHLSQWLVKVGDKVRAGQAIGRVGMTGNTTGPHAHWGVMDGKKYLNPATVWGTGVGGSGGGDMGWLSGIFGLATKVKEMFGDKFKDAGSMLEIAKGTGTKIFTDAKDWLMTKIGDIKDAAVGFVKDTAGKARWTPTATKALMRTGNFSLGNLGSLLARMQKESGFNPRAVNNWDSNAKRGTPSKGLMQVIDPTFRAYRDKRLSSDIFDPLANIVASINYTKARYGSLRKGWDRPGGYANGGLVTPTLFDGGGWLHDTGGPQVIDHRRRKPDAVLTNHEWADIHRLATQPQGLDLSGVSLRLVIEDGRELRGYIEEVSTDNLAAQVRGARQVQRQFHGSN